MAKTGWQRRQERRAKGLDPYSPREREGRRKYFAARSRKRRLDYFAFLAEYKTGTGCVDCGYNAHAAALHFDHLPGSGKVAGLSRMFSYPREVVMAEIAKCEVVCANCHAIRTVSRREVTANQA